MGPIQNNIYITDEDSNHTQVVPATHGNLQKMGIVRVLAIQDYNWREHRLSLDLRGVKSPGCYEYNLYGKVESRLFLDNLIGLGQIIYSSSIITERMIGFFGRNGKLEALLDTLQLEPMSTDSHCIIPANYDVSEGLLEFPLGMGTTEEYEIDRVGYTEFASGKPPLFTMIVRNHPQSCAFPLAFFPDSARMLKTLFPASDLKPGNKIQLYSHPEPGRPKPIIGISLPIGREILHNKTL